MVNPHKTLRQTIFLKDEYLARHHTSVMLLSGIIALSICPEIAHVVITAAALHDTGKVGIPENILFKSEKLSNSEWLIIRQHPLAGAELVRRGNGNMGLKGDLGTVVMAIKHHHERWDGKGYPDGLNGNQIPLAARIISVADTFDAMTSDRPYQKAVPEQMAVKEIVRCAGTQFDPEIVLVFQREIKKYSKEAV
jgi:HD-GYP domain-containing protein (c-di-GMP phosphodiesterase class II)